MPDPTLDERALEEAAKDLYERRSGCTTAWHHLHTYVQEEWRDDVRRVASYLAARPERIEPGQIRRHRDTGLTMEVLRRGDDGRWIVAYLPPDVPRGKNERTYSADSLQRHFPLDRQAQRPSTSEAGDERERLRGALYSLLYGDQELAIANAKRILAEPGPFMTNASSTRRSVPLDEWLKGKRDEARRERSLCKDAPVARAYANGQYFAFGEVLEALAEHWKEGHR